MPYHKITFTHLPDSFIQSKLAYIYELHCTKTYFFLGVYSVFSVKLKKTVSLQKHPKQCKNYRKKKIQQENQRKSVILKGKMYFIVYSGTPAARNLCLFLKNMDSKFARKMGKTICYISFFHIILQNKMLFYSLFL